MIEDHLFWKSRDKFAQLMSNFINGIISSEEFSYNFFALDRKYLELFDAFERNSEKFKNFQHDIKSTKFTNLIKFLRDECYNFE